MDELARGLLREFIQRHPRLFILTGAGCSTDSGIPDYRDTSGEWKGSRRPVAFQHFMADPATRRRYWARSMVGWQRFRRAHPNTAHRALAQLTRHRADTVLVTQNVDGLHQLAGSAGTIDLHGRLDQVRCMQCPAYVHRDEMQQRLLEMNPDWSALQAADAPDGDAELANLDFDSLQIPACSHCGGLLKPDVVFFGESVPPARVSAAMQALHAATAVLVVGSSLMVYSGYRFVQTAARSEKPVAAVNLGRTRADELLALKVEQPCARALAFLLDW
ncbi:MAG: NAD-dependent protein deacetylase [Sinobacteraceae bacterium]|nr:NAD-dependent protein deacetylase [Nevskiaceae bacterium]